MSLFVSVQISRGSGTIFLLVVDCLTSRPGHDALFPAILATFAIYTLLTLPFYVVLGGTIILSVIQTCTFVLFVLPLKTNEVRSAFSFCTFLVFRSYFLSAIDSDVVSLCSTQLYVIHCACFLLSTSFCNVQINCLLFTEQSMQNPHMWSGGADRFVLFPCVFPLYSCSLLLYGPFSYNWHPIRKGVICREDFESHMAVSLFLSLFLSSSDQFNNNEGLVILLQIHACPFFCNLLLSYYF